MADSVKIRERIKTQLKLRMAQMMDRVGGKPTAAQRKDVEEGLQQSLRMVLTEFSRSDQPSADEQKRIIQDVLAEGSGYGFMDELLLDSTITEIMINGPGEIFVERNGRLEKTNLQFNDNDHLMAIIERMLSSVHQTVNETVPLCDASLPDGSRVNVIIPPLTLNGPVVTIRRKLPHWVMQDYTATGAINEQAAEFLQACIRAKVNIIVSGGTSTGKTSLVSILSSYIPQEERVISIENIPELELVSRQHWIRLIGKGANLEGRGEIPLRTLVKNALRMRPDRIILGEARGGEALDIVQAMHSGHDGFMTVLHANSATAALERLETLMLMSGLELPPTACRMQIASAVDMVIHLERFADGSRRITTIAQVLGASQEGFEMENLFAFGAEGFSASGQLQGALQYTGAKPKFLAKFHMNNVAAPTWVAR